MFCEYCGRELADGSKFCPGCGRAIAGVTPQPAPAAAEAAVQPLPGAVGAVNPVNAGGGMPVQSAAAMAPGSKKIMLVNTDYIADREVRMLGMVKGSTVQCKNIGKDISQSFKNIVGGELKAYTEMMDEARDVATGRMIEDAVRMGADAILGIRYATSLIVAGAAEVIAYGTAVTFKN